MSFKAGLLVGAAVGYYYGAKAGRARYEQIERYLQPLRESEQWRDVQQLARGFVDEMLSATKQAVKDATEPDPPDSVRRIA